MRGSEPGLHSKTNFWLLQVLLLWCRSVLFDTLAFHAHATAQATAFRQFHTLHSEESPHSSVCLLHCSGSLVPCTS